MVAGVLKGLVPTVPSMRCPCSDPALYGHHLAPGGCAFVLTRM
jgi:hypothetical protein